MAKEVKSVGAMNISSLNIVRVTITLHSVGLVKVKSTLL
jgi:hypothetical protein